METQRLTLSRSIELQSQQMIDMNSDAGGKGALVGGVAGSPHPPIVN